MRAQDGARKIGRAARRGSNRMKSVLMKLSVAVFGAALLAGCASIGRSRRTRARSSIRSSPARSSPAWTTRLRSKRLSGRPSFTGQFTPNDWYYVSRDTNQFAFRNPRVQQQTVYRVRFDQAGNVVGVDKSGKEMIAAVEPANRKTPTLGRRRSFFDELFGNIGTVGAAGPGQGGGNGPY
jgi:outer membrane protein assembly factor BamE (lipoprotein component of BamABCDE complex)